jgi:hypothetical protein
VIVMPTPVLLSSLIVAYLLATWIALAADADVPLPPTIPADTGEPARPAQDKAVKGDCTDCAVVRSIRQVQRERSTGDVSGYMTSPQYLDQRRYSEPTVGPVVGFSFGPGSEGSRPFVGAAGSSTMRNRILTVVYEVVLRYDDERLRQLEVNEIGDVRVGDRVRVVDDRLEVVAD